MDIQVIDERSKIEQHLTTLFSRENQYIGIDWRDYERLSGRHSSMALLTFETITDVASFIQQLAEGIEEICRHDSCSAILMIETHPFFLRMTDLSSIADTLEGSGILRFQNGISFNDRLPSRTANAELFLFVG